MPHKAFPHYFDVAFDIVTIGTSLGGLKALYRVLGGLPADFPCPILVVQHIPADGPSHLADLLDRKTRLNVKRAENGEFLKAGTVYIAPPDRHLLVTLERSVILADTPKTQFVRPAANALFQSVAAIYKDRAIALVLTGKGKDGAVGSEAIKEHGGRVIAQDELTSAEFGMPYASIATGCVDFVLPLEKIAPALIALVMVRGAAALFLTPPPRFCVNL